MVALNPLDKAGAQFKLAQAYYAAGQRDKAEESVLASLEAAPGYRPAQKLLLEIEHPEQKDAPKQTRGTWKAPRENGQDPFGSEASVDSELVHVSRMGPRSVRDETV